MSHRARPYSLWTILGSLLLASGFSAVHADYVRAANIQGWGTTVDPDGDCQITESAGKLTIKLPTGEHDFFMGNPTPDKRFNAPRVWQRVEGDFTVQVKVSADWTLTPPLANGRSFRGAGLVVSDSEKQYYRLERVYFRHLNAGTHHCLTTPTYDLNERRVNKMGMAGATEFFKGRSTWLRIERRGQQFISSISHDGSSWQQTAAFNTGMHRTVHVGVLALSGSTQDFTADFEDFRLNGKLVRTAQPPQAQPTPPNATPPAQPQSQPTPPTNTQPTPPATAQAATEIEGKVASVADKTITVETTSDLLPAIGDKLTVFVEIPGVGRASVASGKVTSIDGGAIRGQIESSSGTVKPGQLVAVVAPNPTKRNVVKVPSLIGKNATDAKKLLGAAGLTAEFKIGSPAPPGASAYTVYLQAPAANSTAAPGDKVDVMIYAEPKEEAAAE